MMASASARLLDRGARGGIVLVLLILVVAGAVLSPEFTTAANLRNIINQAAPLALLALGQTFVIAAGLIDLSVGQLMGLVTILASDFMRGQPELALPALALALATGLAVGLANGLLDRWLKIHPLILTFGMLSVLQGLIFAYTDQSVGQASPAFIWLAGGALLAIPVPLIIVSGFGILGHWLLTRTRFGLHLRAVGANPDHARRAGVPVRRIRMLIFLLSGASAGLAGILLTGRLGTGYPHAGSGFELDAIVAVVLGGTSLAGGRGSVIGTLAAVLVLAILGNLLNLLGIPAFTQTAIKGCIIVLAILVQQPRSVRA
jgi:ribose/xylose/arabinose/galactoside ABC-type transport system permease subunit